jgi:N6-L-threonylcarbamoyladenine synthase
MRRRSTVLHAIARPTPLYRLQWRPRRCLMTLAIETSCDDTSVAIVEKGSHNGQATAQLHFHKKVTSNNTEYQGVHPLISLQSHQENLAKLVNEATGCLPLQDASPVSVTRAGTVDTAKRRVPDFISVTRGPGMRSNLSTGLDTAKGLAVAWQVVLTIY